MVLAYSDRIPRVLSYSGYPPLKCRFRLRDYHSLWFYFPDNSTTNIRWLCGSVTLLINYQKFGLLLFRSPLLQESLIYFLFLRLMRCFSSPGSPQYTMYSCKDTYSSSKWVSSFGNLRINTYLQFPVAYRSLSRPSSALSAKASSIRSL